MSSASTRWGHLLELGTIPPDWTGQIGRFELGDCAH
jgi:hypothetical protein